MYYVPFNLLIQLNQNYTILFIVVFYSNFKTFDNLEIMNEYLTMHKLPMTVVYFRSKWNPQCDQADKDAQKLAMNDAGINVIKIDSD